MIDFEPLDPEDAAEILAAQRERDEIGEATLAQVYAQMEAERQRAAEIQMLNGCWVLGLCVAAVLVVLWACWR